MRWISVIYSAKYFQTEAILKICQEFTPKVYTQIDRFESQIEGCEQSCRREGLLLEVHGSLRLFGGAQALMQSLQERLHTLLKQHHQTEEPTLLDETGETRPHMKLASADTAWLAWCLCKQAPNYQVNAVQKFASSTSDEYALHALPVQALDLSPNDRQLMMQFGFETVADLMKHAREDLARRFGPSLLRQLDLLSGREAYTGCAQPEMDIYEDQAEMPFHATDQTRIEKLIFQLLCRLENSLMKTKLRAEQLDFQFIQAHEVIPMRVVSAQGLQLAKDWALLIHFQLSQIRFKDDVRWIKIRCERMVPAFDHNGTWLPDPNTDRQQWVELCDKLRARLGEDVIKMAYTIPDPRPELSFEYRASSSIGNGASDRLKQKTGSEKGNKIPSGIVSSNERLPESSVRPLWLLPKPERLRGKAPNWNSNAEWRLLSGPERIDFGWWGKQACKRDYYRALNKELAQAWIFCEEEFHHGKSFINWYIHGYFG